MIESADGASAAAGLLPGDIILTMNNIDVKDAKQFSAMLAKLDGKRPVALLVRRGDLSQFILVKPQAQ